jgi:signal transduction histidine kinase
VGTASVLVEHRAGRVMVEVADHGTGFDPELVSPHRRGISLSIVERMAAAGGRAGVLSSSGLGTRVRLEWPDG